MRKTGINFMELKEVWWGRHHTLETDVQINRCLGGDDRTPISSHFLLKTAMTVQLVFLRELLMDVFTPDASLSPREGSLFPLEWVCPAQPCTQDSKATTTFWGKREPLNSTLFIIEFYPIVSGAPFSFPFSLFVEFTYVRFIFYHYLCFILAIASLLLFHMPITDI